MPETNENKSGLKSTKDLQQYVRSAAAAAEKDERQGYFNAMSWLDLMLEDHPHMFDEFFDKPWHGLNDSEKLLRSTEIRKVL